MPKNFKDEFDDDEKNNQIVMEELHSVITFFTSSISVCYNVRTGDEREMQISEANMSGEPNLV
jgi:hypothetical protein